jgi:hypothetical protein
VVIVRGERAFLVVELALQDAQAGVGQVAGVAPAQQLLALRADDRAASLHGGLVARRGRRARAALTAAARASARSCTASAGSARTPSAGQPGEVDRWMNIRDPGFMAGDAIFSVLVG